MCHGLKHVMALEICLPDFLHRLVHMHETEAQPLLPRVLHTERQAKLSADSRIVATSLVMMFMLLVACYVSASGSVLVVDDMVKTAAREE